MTYLSLPFLILDPPKRILRHQSPGSRPTQLAKSGHRLLLLPLHPLFRQQNRPHGALHRGKQLQLPGGSFSKLHRLNDDSGDFLRILRYSGAPPVSADQASVQDGFPPHKDAVSVAILFTWLGGLQIPDPAAKVEGLNVKGEDWRWVRPEPGYAIVNLGDAMEIFTNML